MTTLARTLMVAAALALFGCGDSTAETDDTTAEPSAPAEGGEAEPLPDEGEPLPGGDTAERQSMTTEECEAQGGELVGDIGDGATHRPDYVCPGGQPPIGNVALGIEGSVCCMP